MSAQHARDKQKLLITELQQKIIDLEKSFDISHNMCFVVCRENTVLTHKIQNLEQQCHSLFHDKEVVVVVNPVYVEPPVPYIPLGEDECTASF